MFWTLWISATARVPLGLDSHNNPVDGWVNYRERWANYKERWVNYMLWRVNYKKGVFRWVNYNKPIVYTLFSPFRAGMARPPRLSFGAFCNSPTRTNTVSTFSLASSIGSDHVSQ